MAKTKQQFHKIKIHPNRWLVWALSISVLTAAGLIAYISVSSLAFEAEMQAPDASRNWRQYTNPEYGFSLNVPPTWSAQSVTGATASFGVKTNPQEGLTITVKDAQKEKAARASLAGFSEQKITVGGVEASEFSSTGEKYVLVNHNGKLYVIKSSSKQFDRVLATFIFIK